MKNSLIFLMQALIVSIITVLLGAEAYLHYKREIEKPVQFECPAVRCPDCSYQKTESFSDDDQDENILPLACIGKNLYAIDDENRLLLRKKHAILCFKSEEIQSLTGYNLFSRDESYVD